ncbi:hypothetical protein G9A89_016961 [Geosiphon pyriformis]|nr:hypothetical protein G9A89_016961 [Geosiphon pyriformis]
MQQQEPEQDQEANSFSDRLNKWYSNVNPRYIDLVGDFGGRELFIIDGDSLLFSFFLDPKTHWLNVTDPMGGGQFLALTFLFETFLKNLLDRSCNFNLVFFEAHKVIWAENSKLLVLRHAIIEHLKEKAKLIELLQFDNWWGTEWQEYLDAWQPLFVLLGDGTTENSYSSESLLTEDTILSNSIKNISVRLGCFCQAFMFFCIRKDISIALIPSIRFQDSRVFAFVFDRIGNMIKNPRFVDEMTKFLEIWCKDFSVHASNLDSEDLVTKLLTNESYKQVLRKGNQRMFFIILSMIPIVRKQQFPQKIIEIFVYHAVLLDYLPLQLRAQKALNSTSPIIISFLEEFYKECAHLLIGKDWRHVVNSLQLECNIGDFIDTRLFGILCALSDCDLVFPVEVERIAKLMLNMVKSLSQSYNSMSSQSTDDIKEPLAIIKSAAQIINPTDEISLLSFQFPFFDKYLGDMNLNLRKAPEKVENIDYGLYGLEGNFKFLEIYHWHILKPLEKKAFSKGKPWDEASARKFKQRSTQKYIYFMQRYSDSLGSKHNQLIITDRSISKKKLVSNASETRSPQTLMKETKVIEKQAKKKEKEARKASKVSEKAQAIRDEKKKKELENAEAESRRNMEKFNQEISTLKTTKSKLNRLSEFIRSSGKLKHPPTMMGAQLLDLQLQLQLWAEEMKTNGNNPDFSKAIDIYRQVFNIFYKFSEILTSQVVEILDEVLVRLGLENSALKIREFRTINSNSSTPYSFQFPLKSIKLSVNLSDARFQLKYGGHSMDHDTNSVYDSRVKTFKPDDWQVEVLNVIDRKESALVCCPTSSGKTFIAFYAMEQVLREDDDGIIVYVAPTKPLVNQITAEVYGRFKKNYPENSGMSHWGIYTREYRENHDCCQILITVPEMLEILMLSPIRSDDWVPKIRRIIFDEIHSIGEADNGIVWEHLLLVAQCPILALSATVGNPEEFSSWIEKAQKLRGKKMHLIQTDKRYSELVKFAYIPSLPFPTFTTVGPEVANSFVRVHPCSALSPIMLRKKGFPKDMKILPDECLNLYDKMRQISGKNESKILNRLNPDNWFRKMIPIRKADTNEYEKEIKEYFRLWAIEDSTIPAVKQIINDFKSPINEQFSKLEASAIQEKDFDAKHNVYDNNFLECSIIHLASELNSQNKLPAIFFHFDRHGCIHLASKILEKLELYETQTRENDMDYQKRKREAIARTNAKEKMTKKGSEGKKKVGRGKSDNWDDNETSIPEDSPEIFDWEKHDPRFTFAHIQSNVSKQELEALLKYSQKQMKGNNIFLLRALERGIAVHHGGMPKKYLQAVEILFRQKYVRIVIATGTLALGI